MYYINHRLVRAFLCLITTSVIILAATPLNAQNYVKDDSYSDADFVKFKLTLVSAILEKDTTKLFSLVGPVINTGDECSPTNVNCFKSNFRSSNSDVVWNELYNMIGYGFSKNKLKEYERGYGKKGDIVFQAPSYHHKFDDGDYQYLLVLGHGVNIREKPTVYSKVVKRSSFEKMKYNDASLTGSSMAGHIEDGKKWFEVVLTDGSLGYVVEDYASASIRHEISIKKIGGKYKIISFTKRPMPGC